MKKKLMHSQIRFIVILILSTVGVIVFNASEVLAVSSCKCTWLMGDSYKGPTGPKLLERCVNDKRCSACTTSGGSCKADFATGVAVTECDKIKEALKTEQGFNSIECNLEVGAGVPVPAKPPPKCVPSKTKAEAGIGQLNLSGLTPECMACGDCKLEDIVKTGAAFANLLTQLSAAFFFATFVYGGAMYLLSFGDKGRVDKGKKAITGAAFGMLIVLMAWTVVNYIANSLKGIK